MRRASKCLVKETKLKEKKRNLECNGLIQQWSVTYRVAESESESVGVGAFRKESESESVGVGAFRKESESESEYFIRLRLLMSNFFTY